jgi:TP901 family phage tail tape measure protein
MALNVGTLAAILELDRSRFDRDMDAADSRFGGLGKKAAAAGVFITASIGAAAVAIGRLGMDYQDNLNMLQEVSRATDAEMKVMRSTAKALGKDLTLPSTSAADAAGAMLELAKAGLSVVDTQKAAKGVLQLAAAGALSEARAAEIAANALNSFRMEWSKATKVADLLAAAANASSSEVEDLAQGMSMASAVFSNAGYTVSDLTTALSLMANAGIKGSDAGTSLKQMLLMLASPSEKTAGLMKEIGFSAYTADGRLKGLSEIIAHTAEVTKGMTQQQRDFALSQIFGADAMRAITVLTAAGAEGFEKMETAVNRAGAAEDLAAARTKGLRGAIDNLKSIAETYALTIYEKVEPAVTDMLRWFGEKIPGAVDDAGDAFGRIATKISGLELGDKAKRFAGQVTDMIDGAREAIDKGDWKGIGKSLGTAVAKALEGGGEMAGKVTAWLGKQLKKVDWMGLGIEAGKQVPALLIGLAAGIINFDLLALLGSLGEHWFEILMAVISVGLAPAKFTGKIAELLGKIPLVGTLLSWAFKHFDDFAKGIVGKIGDVLGAFGKGFAEKLGIEAPHLIARFKGMLDGLILRVMYWAEDLWKAALRAMERFGASIAEHGPKQAVGAMRKVKDAIFGFLADAGSWLLEIGKKVVRGLLRGVDAVFPELGPTIKGIPRAVKEAMGDAGKLLYDVGRKVIKGFIDGVGSMFGSVKDKFGELTDKLTSWKGPPSRDRTLLHGAGQMVMDGFIRGIEARRAAIRSTLQDITNMVAAAGATAPAVRFAGSGPDPAMQDGGYGPAGAGGWEGGPHIGELHQHIYEPGVDDATISRRMLWAARTGAP